jgi:hypothetical protein
MSRTAHAASLPENIQLIQTNSTPTDSSSINNQISQRQNHLIQFANETTIIDNNSIHNNIKQENTNPHRTYSKRSKSFKRK